MMARGALIPEEPLQDTPEEREVEDVWVEEWVREFGVVEEEEEEKIPLRESRQPTATGGMV